MTARSARLLLAFVGCLSVQALLAAPLDDIVNYREYSATLSSSGQPNADQLEYLRDAGFERVVFLAFSDHEGSIPNEDRIVKDLGMHYVHIPVDWDAPSKSDFYAFAGAMQREPDKKTLVHCQVNFRASAFSFLYRVLFEGVPMGQAKDDMDAVWVPNDTWRSLIFDTLEENDVSPHCDTCLWVGGQARQ
jgi:protein tyrosine phosphatase (PTP) superfamily phosphohydrolase (DUF442 family)